MKKFVPIIFILAAISVLFFLIRPALLGELGGTFKSTIFPNDYKTLETFLSSQNHFFRTLWLPTKQRFGFYSNLHPAISANELFNTNDILKLTVDLKTTNEEQKLKDLGVKYIIVPYDSQKEIFIKERKYSSLLYENVIKNLRKISWLEEKTGFGQIKIFELKDPMDHFWTLSKKLSISYTYISPVEYLVKLDEAKEGDIIVFAESFDANWIATMDKTRIPSVEYENKLNSFILPRDGDYKLKIYYLPQNFVNIGLIVSVITFTATILILLFI